MGSHRWPGLEIPILTGVSAGAINAVFLASRPAGLAAAAEELVDFWAEITTERVFRTEIPFLARNLLRWATRPVSGGSSLAPEARSLVDTSPLAELLSLGRAPPGRSDGNSPLTLTRGLPSVLHDERIPLVAWTRCDPKHPEPFL